MKRTPTPKPASVSQEDIGGLLAVPPTEVRVMSARRIASEFARPGLSSAERNLAIDAFRLLARDAEVAVRAGLADALRDEPLVPHDVIHALASDVAAVALPVLEHSIVLSDEDLIEVIRAGESAQRRAVARRAQVSAVLADVLVESRDENVVNTLLRNPGAEIAEATYDVALRAFPGTSPVLAALSDHRFGALLRSLAQRSHMPVFLAERLIARVADKVRAAFLACDHVTPATAEAVVARSRERSTVALLRHGRDCDAAELARHLIKAGRLTPSLVLRALFQGHVPFVLRALAEASGATEAEVTAAAGQRKGGMLGHIAAAAGMPPAAVDAVASVLAVARACKYRGGLMGFGPFLQSALDRVGAHDADAYISGLDLESVRLGAALPDSGARIS